MSTCYDGLISLVIPSRNRAAIIGEAIRRCLDQVYRNIQVVVADNSDDDLTRIAVHKFRDERLRYLHTGKLSMADNWQKGLQASSGDYVYVIADKVLLHPQTVSTSS